MASKGNGSKRQTKEGVNTMSFFKKFTTRQLYVAINESIDKFEQAEDKDEMCNPDAPILISINGKKHYVLSYGGDPDEEGLILDCKPAAWWK
jgi:hypothetical protein